MEVHNMERQNLLLPFLRRKLVENLIQILIQILKQIARRPSSDGNLQKATPMCPKIAKELSQYGTPKLFAALKPATTAAALAPATTCAALKPAPMVSQPSPAPTSAALEPATTLNLIRARRWRGAARSAA